MDGFNWFSFTIFSLALLYLIHKLTMDLSKILTCLSRLGCFLFTFHTPTSYLPPNLSFNSHRSKLITKYQEQVFGLTKVEHQCTCTPMQGHINVWRDNRSWIKEIRQTIWLERNFDSLQDCKISEEESVSLLH